MKFTSAEIKRGLLYYCLIQLNHRLAVTEALNGADVLSVGGVADYTTEYEIKVSRSDLKGELDTMLWVIDEDYYRQKMAEIEPGQLAIFGPEYPHGQELLERRRKLHGSHNKIYKHSRNLVPGAVKYPAFQPNYFYFVSYARSD